ncbi:hypothetical protein [Haladaptatus halobius]|uniref:hypothetical protein n=1 Tax=Haladaptatus halobius TaxID=2884875 RepID=UPI001D0AAD11|nr:hypothetical protein [Haladaptatus halobius]
MSESGSGNTMRERVGNRRDRIRLYILLNLDRRVLTGALTGGMFLVFLIAGAYSVPPFRMYMRSMGPTRYLFQAFVGALITGLTLVVTINQLVLSQELGPLGSQRERMNGAMGFRGDVEDVLGSVSPPEPEAFLQALIDNSRERAQTLQETVSENPNDDLVKYTNQITNDIIENAEVVTDQLENRNFGEYAVVKAALDYNYSYKIYQVQRLRDKYADDLSDEELYLLIDLLKIFTFFGSAREHIKTLYFQWELVDLSRGIIYSSIPAIAVTGTIALYLAPASFSGITFGIDNLIWIVSAGTAIGTFPFFFLSTYILRLATIAKRTLAIGPFILRGSERSSEIEWE